MINMLENLNLISTSVRIILALLCGGLLGIERGKKGRPAGFRTHILVCVGSTLVMITNEYMCIKYGNVDPSRMGAQVISGIGFLGAGTIMVTGFQRIKGLTTAACLWVDACIGLALGIGFYYGGILVCLVSLLVNTVFHTFENHINASYQNAMTILVEMGDVSDVGMIMKEITDKGISIIDFELSNVKKNKKHCGALITISLIKGMDKAKIMEFVSTIHGILRIEEVR